MFAIIQAAGWPIWPLILCSILALAFVAERFIKLKSARVLTPGLVDEAIGVSRTAPPAPHTVNQLAQHSALGQVLAAGPLDELAGDSTTLEEAFIAIVGESPTDARLLDWLDAPT